MSDIETSREDAPGAGAVGIVEDDAVDEIVDLEEHAKAGKKPPKARRYRIRIDRDRKEVEAPGLTGRQILALVGKTPEEHLLSQKAHGGRVDPVKAEQFVDFTAPGIERFQTLALDPTEG